jgi:hypothetical protein
LSFRTERGIAVSGTARRSQASQIPRERGSAELHFVEFCCAQDDKREVQD